jgi:hypothetical protein
MPLPVGVPNYPLLFKHMVLAIYKGGRVVGTPKQRMADSIEIALSQLKKYEYITEDSSKSRITLTTKGVKKNQTHLKEADKNPKTKLFDSLYTQLVSENQTTVTAQVGGLPSGLMVGGKPFKKL